MTHLCKSYFFVRLGFALYERKSRDTDKQEVWRIRAPSGWPSRILYVRLVVAAPPPQPAGKGWSRGDRAAAV